MSTTNCEMDGGAITHHEQGSVESIVETISNNLWLAGKYAEEGKDGLAKECIRAAWEEYGHHTELVNVYAGCELGDHVKRLMVEWELL